MGNYFRLLSDEFPPDPVSEAYINETLSRLCEEEGIYTQSELDELSIWKDAVARLQESKEEK